MSFNYCFYLIFIYVLLSLVAEILIMNIKFCYHLLHCAMADLVVYSTSL